MIESVDAPVLTNVTEVESGSTVNGIYLRVEVSRTGTTSDVLANVYMMVVKNTTGALNFPNANTVGSSDLKKYVVHQEMVMLQGNNASNPRTLFNGVIVIPRLYRRMSQGDFLQVMVFAPGVNINLCIQCHYKEFR